jgi:hypothetical protein
MKSIYVMVFMFVPVVSGAALEVKGDPVITFHNNTLEVKGDPVTTFHDYVKLPSVGCCNCPSGEHCVSSWTGHYCVNSDGSSPLTGCGSYDPFSLACCM